MYVWQKATAILLLGGTMNQILEYIREKYHPISVILYGSFADHSNNEHSDFDALVITDAGEIVHDNTIIDGTELDVFVYPKSVFAETVNYEDYIQVYDGKIIQDTDGIGAKLKQEVTAYADSRPAKTEEENRTSVEWCEKMLMRALRGDAEGLFRRHWLLTDSLQIYCDLAGRSYRGPKKSLRYMKEHDPEGYEKYTRALSSSSWDDLSNWIAYLKGFIS